VRHRSEDRCSFIGSRCRKQCNTWLGDDSFCVTPYNCYQPHLGVFLLMLLYKVAIAFDQRITFFGASLNVSVSQGYCDQILIHYFTLNFVHFSPANILVS
jgi:hypothetical protein